MHGDIMNRFTVTNQPIYLTGLLLLLVALIPLAFIAPAQAQTVEVFDDFEDGLQTDEYFTFDGVTSIGLSESTEVPANNGGTTALAADFSTGAGGFVGGFGKEDVNSDLTGFAEPRLNFYYKFNAGSANTAFTIEANIQEDEDLNGSYDTGADDEFRFLIRVNGASDYGLVSVDIPAGLLNQNGQAGGDGDFNGIVNGVVFSINSATEDDGTGDAEGGQLVIDYISFTDGEALETPPFSSRDTFDDFEDGIQTDEYDIYVDPASLTLTTVTDVPATNGGSSALSAEFVSGSEGGFVGGFAKSNVLNIGTADEPRVNLYYKFNANSPTSAFVLEVNVQEDENGNGSYDEGADDEFRGKVRVTGSPGYNFVSFKIDEMERNLNGQVGGDGEFNGTVAGMAFSVNGATPDDGAGNPEGGEFLIDAVTYTAGGPLPVELAGFDARLDGSDAVLSWRTLSETNNAGFDVQVASGEADFLTVGSVDGAGTTTEPQRYTFRVPNLDPGVHRFRLRQVDVDGTTTLSEVQVLTLGSSAPFTMVQNTANPVQSGQTAQMKFIVGEREPVQAALYNVLGQRVRTLFDATATPGAVTPLTIRTEDLASGVYFIRITGATFSRTEQISVVR